MAKPCVVVGERPHERMNSGCVHVSYILHLVGTRTVAFQNVDAVLSQRVHECFEVIREVRGVVFSALMSPELRIDLCTEAAENIDAWRNGFKPLP